MKKSMILEVCQNDRGKSERFPLSTKQKEYLNKLCDSEHELEKELKNYPDLLEMYKRVIDFKEKLEIEDADTYFLEGFKIGLLIGIEASEPY